MLLYFEPQLYKVVLILALIDPKTNLAAFGAMADVPADYSNVRALGREIYTTYLLPFELAAVLLVLGMVAAIALTHRGNKNPRYIDPAEQVKVQAKDRFRMVKIQPEVEVVEAAEGETKQEVKS